jgi:carboxypeptidase Q
MRPRRTIRVVLWTNEENGIAGAKAYRAAHKSELANHVLAIECDDGVFKPTAFAFSGSETSSNQVGEVASLLQKITPMKITSGAGGADISQLEPDGVPLMDLIVEGTKYFWYHHTNADTIDKINRDELNQCVAAMAVMSYVIADSPERLAK